MMVCRGSPHIRRYRNVTNTVTRAFKGVTPAIALCMRSTGINLHLGTCVVLGNSRGGYLTCVKGGTSLPCRTFVRLCKAGRCISQLYYCSVTRISLPVDQRSTSAGAIRALSQCAVVLAASSHHLHRQAVA
jgi:hypothetical protein